MRSTSMGRSPKRRLLGAALAIALATVGAPAAARAAEPNDDFAARASVSGESTFISTNNLGASKEAGEPDHAGNSGGASLWWAWEAPAHGTVSMSTSGSSFDTLLAVYVGASFDSLAEVASDDDCIGLASCVTFTASAGADYAIAVDGFNGSEGHLELAWATDISEECTIRGTPGPDVLSGTPAEDVICGVGGNDILFGRGGDDILDGGAGSDTVSYVRADQGVKVNLFGISATGEGNDTLPAIENVVGSRFEDLIDGDDNANVLSGGAEIDKVAGNGGDDDVRGGSGDDNIYMGLGDDRGRGGAGIDTVHFFDAPVVADLGAGTSTGEGSDMFSGIENGTGSFGDDTIRGTVESNLLRGNEGRDVLRGLGGGDDLRGLEGVDDLHGENGDDILTGGPEDDFVNGGAGFDRCIPDEGTDARISCESLLPPIAARRVVSDVAFPAAFTIGADGRIFFGERLRGRIRVFDPATGTRSTMFTVPNLAAEGEQGLLGLALHPEFPARPFVYAYATRNVGGRLRNQILRITVTDGTGSDMTVIFSAPAGRIHNGGKIAFSGRDGMLYAVIGENGVPARSQNLDSAAGKVLRMTPRGRVPADNPFSGSRVFAYGIRNSFGFDFDPATGWLWETENGPECNDELNLILPGRNYGWGPAATCASPPAAPRNTNQDGPDPVLPQTWYTPPIVPTGAAFCSRCELDAGSEGRLFYSAFNAKEIRRVGLDAGRRTVASEIVAYEHDSKILAIEADPNGRLFFSDANAIYMLVQSP